MTSRHGYLYQFEHRILPGLLFQRFDWFTSLLAEGSEAFTFLLQATEVALGADVPRDEPIKVSCVKLEGDCHLALFVFPPPVKSLEAYYAAAVWAQDGRIHRYLVLERSQDSPPYLAEWLGNGSRLNWGPMLDLQYEAFLRQVIQTLYRPRTRPERSAPGDPTDPFPLLPLLAEGLRKRKVAAIADLPANTGKEYLARARSFAGVQAYEQALADAQSARVLLPGNLQALIVEAEILSDLDQLAMAEPFYRYYLRRVGSDPTEPGLRLRLAELQRRAELYPQALQHANEAIRLRECSQTYLGRALIRSACNDQRGAMEDVCLALREDPRNPHAIELRAGLLGDSRQWRAACVDLERLLVLEPGHHRARFLWPGPRPKFGGRTGLWIRCRF